MNFKFITPTKLSLIGYFYNKSEIKKNGNVYLRCEDRKNCNAGITIAVDKIIRIGRKDVSNLPEEELKALINESHLHAPAIDMKEVIRESVEAMKIRCSIEPNKNPSEIFDEERKVLELKYKNVALIGTRNPE